jgi:diacylglycerol kinase (ATP)
LIRDAADNPGGVDQWEPRLYHFATVRASGRCIVPWNRLYYRQSRNPPVPDAISILPPTTNRVVIAINPKTGDQSAALRVEQLVELLRHHGFHVEPLSDLQEVADRANGWHAEGCLRALVGVGGDGTAAELVNRTTPGVPITMLPSGNENLLARYLGLGRSPEACCETITAGTVMRLDAGKANDRLFLLMAGCGFDADVVWRVHESRQGRVTRASYLKPIVDSIRSYEYPELRIQWDEEAAGVAQSPSPSAGAHWLFAFNLPRYGGGLEIAPGADGGDGLLDVCTFRHGGVWHGLLYAGAVLLGQHHRLADFAVRRAGRLRITADSPVPYQLDGDPGGWLPLDIEALPGRLSVLTPKMKEE